MDYFKYWHSSCGRPYCFEKTIEFCFIEIPEDFNTMSEDDSSSTTSCVSDIDSSNVSVLSWEQVQRLDAILTETIPIHGRGNFPTLEMQPRQIVKVVRSRMEEKQIHVRDVRLNGSAASHILHEDSGLGYKDLDLIFCANMKGESDFQTVKDIVLDCLLDFLPDCVNKEKITPLTLKVGYTRPGRFLFLLQIC